MFVVFSHCKRLSQKQNGPNEDDYADDEQLPTGANVFGELISLHQIVFVWHSLKRVALLIIEQQCNKYLQ